MPCKLTAQAAQYRQDIRDLTALTVTKMAGGPQGLEIQSCVGAKDHMEHKGITSWLLGSM